MTPYHQDDWLTVWQGDCREVMAQMPAESVHTVVTSPPYWGLRDYGTASWLGGSEDCDHLGPPRMSDKTGLSHPELKPREQILAEPSRLVPTPYRHECGKCGAVRQDSQLGLEPTPEEYVANMVAVFREVRRVLRADGTCWVNLGDAYNSSPSNQMGKAGSGMNEGRPKYAENGQGGNGERQIRKVPGLKPKDLVGIPWRVAFALQADGWYLRSDIVWSKANPMPESVTDRPTKSHEYVFLLSKSPRYYFDADAVREGLYDVSADAPVDGVSRPTEPARRVVTMPTLFDGADAGVEGAQPGSGADQPAKVGGVGVGQGDQESPRSVGPQAGEGGRVSPLRTGARGEPAGAAITSGPSPTGSVLPRAADGDGGTIDADGARVGGDPDGTGLPLSVLRGTSTTDDGSRSAIEQGRGAHEGERGGGVPTVQQSEARQAAGRNLRSVWHLATQPYPGAHFATFPEKLVEPCVKAGTSERGVCPECGAPWRRVVERTRFEEQSIAPKAKVLEGMGRNDGDRNLGGQQFNKFKAANPDITTGWQRSCEHGPTLTMNQTSVPAVVLDPFAGSGTTGRVAQRLGRRAVLIDLSGEYLVQAMNRNTEIPLGLETA